MPYSSSGVYSATAGAETATAGQTIASATWNQINSDYRTALTTLGQGASPLLTSGIKNDAYFTAPQTVNFAASAGDIGVFNIVLPISLSTYRLLNLRIGNAAANLNSSTVSLFTGAGATGVAVISSTATTVTATVPNAANSLQVMTPASVNTVAFQAVQLFLHITASTATSSTASVILMYEPLF